MTREEFIQKQLLYFKGAFPELSDADVRQIMDVYFEWGEYNKIEERKLLTQIYFFGWVNALEKRLLGNDEGTV